jgi:hypothetical protein
VQEATVKRLTVAATVAALMLTGCASRSDSTTEIAPSGAVASADVTALLAEYGLAGKDTVQVIDHLDRLTLEQRPAADLKASVRPHELVLSRGGRQASLAVPGDRFYLSVAPYVNGTHDCFHHSLTTCKGELAAEDVGVRIVDETHDEVLVDEVRTTFANGFVGFWLPRDINGILQITYGSKSGRTKITTAKESPTCLTTLRLT